MIKSDDLKIKLDLSILSSLSIKSNLPISHVPLIGYDWITRSLTCALLKMFRISGELRYT